MPKNKTGEPYRKTARWNGKKYEATGRTELEALTRLADKIAAAKRGEEALNGSMTVNAWYKEWKATYKDPKGLTPKVSECMMKNITAISNRRSAT